jgi:hypothetical protein
MIETIRRLARLNSVACCQIENFIGGLGADAKGRRRGRPGASTPLRTRTNPLDADDNRLGKKKGLVGVKAKGGAKRWPPAVLITRGYV